MFYVFSVLIALRILDKFDMELLRFASWCKNRQVYLNCTLLYFVIKRFLGENGTERASTENFFIWVYQNDASFCEFFLDFLGCDHGATPQMPF